MITSTEAPFVTVLMPVFNAAPFLRRSIESVLYQDFSDFELLIVDDGSTDDSISIIRSFTDSRIRLLQLPKNLGFVEALNHGLANARAPWIARQDADDLSRRDRLREQVNLLMTDPEIDLLYSDARLINDLSSYRGILCSPQSESLLRWDLCFRNAIPHSSVFFRRDTVFDKLGGYRRDNVSADYDLWTRLLANGHAKKCEGALVSYRLHTRSIMGTENSSSKKMSSTPLREIMLENIKNAVDTFAPDDAQVILDAWTDGEAIDWPRYFEKRLALLNLFVAKHPDAVGMDHLISQQDYTLFHRVLRKGRGASLAFLSALNSHNRRALSRLPWIKVAYSLLNG
ncbi:MAG: glycosyltransferase [Chthoniobacterales bacterium]